jgi:homoserine dehydrogenase
MNTQKINIGLFGFGAVGQGFYKLVGQRAKDKINIIRIAVKDPKKERTLDRSAFTFDYRELLHAPDLQIIVEATDDERAGYEIIKTALLKGIPVVSANKKLLANNLEEFVDLSIKTQTPLLYEAAAAGAIPIITSLDSYFKDEVINSIRGIINGTTNYILSSMLQQGISFATALKNAQELGFAESDPKNDVDAYDAAFKLVLLSVHAFGKILGVNDILRYGIRFIKKEDHQEAEALDKVIKLIAHVFPSGDGIEGLVLPTWVAKEDDFSSVSAEFNAIEILAKDSGAHLLKGKGAGSLPTGSALLNDVIKALSGGYTYKKLSKAHNPDGNEIEVILTLKNPSEIKGLLEVQEQVEASGNIKIIAWINTRDLKAQIGYLEENEAGLISTGRIRKVIKQSKSDKLSCTEKKIQNEVLN